MGRLPAAYPGQLRPASPRPAPRVKPEGEPNYVRNKGTIKARAFDNTAPAVLTPKPSPRCPTSASRGNYKKGWFGNVAPMLDGSASPRPHTAPPRVKPDAEATAQVSKGGRMKVIVNEYAKKPATPRQPRVKPEAEGTAEVSKGGRMKNLQYKYGNLPLSDRGVPRVKSEAEGIAELSKGGAMHNTIHKYGNNRLSPRPEPRVKPEAAENADLDRGKRMETIVNKYGRGPLCSRAVPRVSALGEDNANLDKGFRMNFLMHSPGRIPGTPRPAPRTCTPSARGNAFKGRGSMDKIFDQISKSTYIHRPGVQSHQYVRASVG